MSATNTLVDLRPRAERRSRMVELTSHVASVAPDFDRVFRDAVDHYLQGGKRPRADYATLAYVRAAYGFAHDDAPLLTLPNGNAKLAKGYVPTYGFTGQHHRVVLPARDGFPRLVLNACPNAGHCTRVCVLDNGHGQDPAVQRARVWRTDLLARHPDVFARILAWELVQAIRKHGRILFRPNVNTDVAWQDILPTLTNGYLAGVMSYGYSKRPETLTAGDGAGNLGAAYRVSYSWNEQACADDVAAFVARGGAVAVVTGRAKHAPTLEHFPFDHHDAPIADADVTDEWMLTGTAVIGDLSAKGRARKLIGRSRFVVAA